MEQPVEISPLPKGWEAPSVRTLTVDDLSHRPRTGFKGRGTTAWLTAQHLVLPQAANTATVQSDGTFVAWLGGEEFLLLSHPADQGSGLCNALEETWRIDRAEGEVESCFPLPRQDSHAWLWLKGEHVPALMSKVCGVDVRPSNFAHGQVAQTVAARISVILIRADDEDRYGIYLLADRASGHYLADVLVDAAAEFVGGRR